MRVFPRRLRHGEEATLVEHLEELRARIFVVLIALVVAFVVTYAVHGMLLDWLNRPLPAHLKKPYTFSPLEPFSTSLWVSFWGAFLLTIPIIFWQVWAFFAPAVDERHQRSIAVLVGFSAALALAGVAFGYWVVLPPAIHFLTNYDSSHFTILIQARPYYTFAAIVLLAVAIAFEVPIFVLGLVRLRILSAARLRRTWRMGVFAMVIIGVALPGVDPVSTILSTVPLVALYLLSIVLATVLEPRWRKSWEDDLAEDDLAEAGT